jgi:hypothetical protein
MARRKTATATRSSGVVVVTPPAAPLARRRSSGGSRRRRRAPSRRRRSGGVLGGHSGSERPMLYAVGSALALGFLQRSGVTIPRLFNLTPQATAGIGAYVWARMTKSPTAAHAATGLLSVAAYMFGTGMNPAGTIVGQYPPGMAPWPEPYPGTAAIMGDDDDDVEGDDDDDD